MKKYLKSNKGFTLVEVIVVAVIVLVLAAVAIPLYSGYVKDSRRAAADNLAGAIASSLGSVKQQGKDITPTNYDSNGGFLEYVIPVGGIGTSLGLQIPKGFIVNIVADGVTVTHAGEAGAWATARF
jgi:prepilin-type N-terminal cleavage/methylation domain-containing protein